MRPIPRPLFWIGMASLLLLLLLTVFWLNRDAPITPASGGSVRPVVMRGELRTEVETLGRVRAGREVRLSVATGGTVRMLAVEAGSVVTGGQPLLALDSTESDARVGEARAGVAVAEAQATRVAAGPGQSEIELAQAQLRRAEVALAAAQAAWDAIADEPDAATTDEAVRLEAARTDVLATESALRRAVEGAAPEELAVQSAQLAQARRRLDDALTARQALTLTAPFDGQIIRREVAVGERVGPNQPLLVLVDPQTIQLVAEVDEVDIAHVAPGQAATVRLDALPTEVISATVLAVAPAPLPQRGSTIYETTLTLIDPPATLRLGMSGTVIIQTADMRDVLVLPLAAIRRAGRESYVRLADGSERSVILGPDDGSSVVILEGLAEGDVVIPP